MNIFAAITVSLVLCTFLLAVAAIIMKFVYIFLAVVIILCIFYFLFNRSRSN